MIEEFVAFGSSRYWVLLGLLLFARGADFLSTWVATPHMVLEGNPIARRLGWKWGAIVNLGLCVAFATWPLSAIVIGTTSLLVAARNFQSAWLMRTLGEEVYRDWYIEKIQSADVRLYVFCLLGQTLLISGVGSALMIFYEGKLVPFAVGLGIVAYSLAVTFYTSLALWRIRRAMRPGCG